MLSLRQFSPLPTSLLLLLLLTSTPTIISGYRFNNLPCRAHFQCLSGFCNEKLICEAQRADAVACQVHEACESGRCSGGVCQIQYQVGQGPCSDHEECYEGYCNTTTTICSELKPKQESCVDDFECRSGRCFANPRRCEFVIYEGAICGKDSDCFGDRCKMKNQGGDNRCYPRKWNNESCHHNSDCLSLRCETQNCTEPGWVGSPCDEPSDCYSLFCNKEKGCVATADEADNDEIEPEWPGIAGSLAQESVNNGGGSVDLGQGTVFVANGGSTSSATYDTMARMAIATMIGLVGAAAAIMV